MLPVLVYTRQTPGAVLALVTGEAEGTIKFSRPALS